jgi:hypothetical protein
MFEQIVTLPDGTQAVIIRSLTWGEATIILLLAALLVLKIYELWVYTRD